MDSYQILGVSRNASDEEIKSVYRKLIRKYHPDANPDGNEQATLKFMKIQDAYESIVFERKHGGGSQKAAQSDQENAGGQATFDETADPRYYAVSKFFEEGRYFNVIDVLSQFDKNLRRGLWHFHYARALMMLQEYMDAYEYIKKACEFDPESVRYSYTKAYIAKRIVYERDAKNAAAAGNASNRTATSRSTTNTYAARNNMANGKPAEKQKLSLGVSLFLIFAFLATIASIGYAIFFFIYMFFFA